MTYDDEQKMYTEIIEKNNGQNIKRYSLISNWGFSFTIDGASYDARFVANCYGVALNCFQVYTSNGKKEIAQKIENELNNAGNLQPKTFWDCI